MYTLVIAVHVILAITLIGLVLLQQGKGADVGAVMSGGGANTLFGVGGASSLLVRMTTSVAILFMLTSVLLVRFSSAGGGVTSGTPDAMRGSVVEGLAVNPPSAHTAAPVVTPSAPEAAPVQNNAAQDIAAPGDATQGSPAQSNATPAPVSSPGVEPGK